MGVLAQFPDITHNNQICIFGILKISWNPDQFEILGIFSLFYLL